MDKSIRRYCNACADMVRAYFSDWLRAAPLPSEFRLSSSAPFLMRNLKMFSMELYTSKFIHGILYKKPESNNHEKYFTIFSFTKYHNILLNFNIIQFDEDCISCCATMKLTHLYDIKLN